MTDQPHKKRPTGKPADVPADRGIRWLRPETVFVTLGLAAGLFMALVTPPFQAPDENTHFLRAFQLLEGRLIAQRRGEHVGGLLPLSLYSTWARFQYIPFHPLTKASMNMLRQDLWQPVAMEPRCFIRFSNTAIYTPVVYLPQMAGMVLGRATIGSALGMMYLGRLANLACWIMLIYLAIRTTPVFKWAVVLIGLMPMALFLGASLSADVTTNALAILLVAVILRTRLAEAGPMSLKERILVLAMCMLLSVSKQIYCPLVLLIVLIPRESFGGRNRKLVYCGIVLAASVVLTLAWAYIIRDILVGGPVAKPDEQMSYVLSQPWGYAATYVRTLLKEGVLNVLQFVGFLGWLDTRLPNWIYMSYPAMLVLAGLTGSGGRTILSLRSKLLILSLCLFECLLISTLQYVTWSPLKHDVIAGVQGRYAIPLALPLLLVLSNEELKVPEKLVGRVVAVYCAAVLITTCVTLFQRYYI